MKRFMFVLLSIVMAVLLVGCGGKKLTKEAKDLGNSAYEVMDDFLTGRLTYDEASDKLKNISNLLDAAEENAHDAIISANIGLIKVCILGFRINANGSGILGSEYINKAKEDKEELGKIIGR